MTKAVKVLVSKPDDLRSIPGTCMVERGSRLPMLTSDHMFYGTYACMHIHTNNNKCAKNEREIGISKESKFSDGIILQF